MEYNITFSWDNEASVWIATSNDIPGLVLESDSLDILIERTKHAISELIELDKVKSNSMTINFLLNRQERIAL